MNRECHPSCSNFRCLKKALIFVSPSGRIFSPKGASRYRGRLTAWCSWANDACQGAKCQYANCIKRALLPDGRCALKVGTKGKVRSIEEEAKDLEHEYLRLRPILRKLKIEDLDL